MPDEIAVTTEIPRVAVFGRGVEYFERKMKSLRPVIAGFEDRKPLRVLELGCGYGQLLIGLMARHPGRIEAIGINRHKGNGTTELAWELAKRRGLVARSSKRPVGQLEIRYANLENRLPFEDRTFDLVVSQMALIYVHKKLEVLREVQRVLKPEGEAILHLYIHRWDLPSPFDRSLRLFDRRGEVDVASYFERVGGRYIRKGTGAVELHGHSRARWPMRLLHSYDLHDVFPAENIKDYYGTHSVYSVPDVDAG
jgi:SAM-dependent methyltransferase